jgi:hypothetical protein
MVQDVENCSIFNAQSAKPTHMKSFIVFFLLISLSLKGFSQVNQEIRREFTFGDDYSTIGLHVLNPEMIFLCSRYKKDKTTYQWKFMSMDKDLNPIDSVELQAPVSYYLVKVIKGKDELLVFCANSKNSTWRLTRICGTTMEVSHLEGKLPKKTFPRYADILGDKIVVTLMAAVRVYDRPGDMIIIDLKDGNSTHHKVPKLNKKKVLFHKLEVHPESNLIMLYMTYSGGKIKRIAHVQIWDGHGEMIDCCFSAFLIPQSGERSL